MERITKVYICSPYKSRGNVEDNQDAARLYSRKAIEQFKLPITPHIYFTQFLDDEKIFERAIGLNLGIKLLKSCDEVWVFGEITGGMVKEVEVAKENRIPIRWFDERGVEHE